MPFQRLVILIASLAMLTACATENVYHPAPGQKMHITQGTMQGFKEYQQIIGSTHPGAFAVSEGGDAYSYYYCRDVACLSGTASYAQDALRDCARFGQRCYIFANGNDIKYDYVVSP